MVRSLSEKYGSVSDHALDDRLIASGGNGVECDRASNAFE